MRRIAASVVGTLLLAATLAAAAPQGADEGPGFLEKGREAVQALLDVDGEVILEVFADTGKFFYDRDAQALQ